MHRELVCCIIVLFVCLNVRAWKLKEGDDIDFPKHPLSHMVVENTVFNRTLYFVYRLANPLMPGHRNVQLMLVKLDNYTFTDLWEARMNGRCKSGEFVFNRIPEECDRAVYTSDGPFPSTGEGFTISFFSSCPWEYMFIFYCLDRTKEYVNRHGRRVTCHGPWTIMFGIYQSPPDQVKWCSAEHDLWTNYHLTFDNEFMRYEPSGFH